MSAADGGVTTPDGGSEVPGAVTCRACGKPSFVDDRFGKHFHADGSNVSACWRRVALLRKHRRKVVDTL